MQLTLTLIGGYDAGLLFCAAVKRSLKRSIRGAARFKFLQSRTPKWANKKSIRHIYKKARKLTALSRENDKSPGVLYSVDHIVPLNHPLVCGLHVESNLRVMLLAENQAKGNAWWPDMWGVQTVLELCQEGTP